MCGYTSDRRQLVELIVSVHLSMSSKDQTQVSRLAQGLAFPTEPSYQYMDIIFVSLFLGFCQ